MRIRDWSSDVCSSDLPVPGGERVGSGGEGQAAEVQHGGPGRDDGACSACDADAPVVGGGDGGGAGDGVGHAGAAGARVADRKSVVEGKSVSVRVDLGGCRIIKKTKITIHRETQ